MSLRRCLLFVSVAGAALLLCAPSAFPEAAAPPKELSLDLGNGLKMDFVIIPAGSFLMGDEKGDKDERPAHKVSLTKAFYLGKYEVTQEQWKALMDDEPSLFKGEKNPVESVTWGDCQEFLKSLAEKFNGKAFRLPTEAEWEYACRAGTATRFSFGDNPDDVVRYGWCLLNASRGHEPVGQKKANPWGLYDIHGNVWEWCQDWYGPYEAAAQTDPTGPASGEAHVVRGGSWFRDLPTNLRSATRFRARPTDRFYNVGLRVVLQAP